MVTTTTEDLYAVLGVSKDASQEQIRQQYRVLVKKYHPDLHPGDKNAEAMMEQVNEAYDVLGNEEQRRTYDMEQSSPFERASAQSAPQQPTGPQGFGPDAWGDPGSAARGHSSWNPQWGDTADSRSKQADAEAAWETMRAQERAHNDPFGGLWSRMSDDVQDSQINGFVVVGNILGFVLRIVFGILFTILRVLTTRWDNHDRFF